MESTATTAKSSSSGESSESIVITIAVVLVLIGCLCVLSSIACALMIRSSHLRRAKKEFGEVNNHDIVLLEVIVEERERTEGIEEREEAMEEGEGMEEGEEATEGEGMEEEDGMRGGEVAMEEGESMAEREEVMEEGEGMEEGDGMEGGEVAIEEREGMEEGVRMGEEDSMEEIERDTTGGDEPVERVKRVDVNFLTNELFITAAKWREIGMGLGFVYGELNNIAATGPGAGPVECLTRMLADWAEWPNSRHKNNPTLDKLCEVLRTVLVGEGALANELETKKDHLPSLCNFNQIL
jgi:hypothetical protein